MTTKGKFFSELDETQKSSSLSVKYFVTVATLNVTLVQWQICGDIFPQRWLSSAQVLPVKYRLPRTPRAAGEKMILYVKSDL